MFKTCSQENAAGITPLVRRRPVPSAGRVVSLIPPSNPTVRTDRRPSPPTTPMNLANQSENVTPTTHSHGFASDFLYIPEPNESILAPLSWQYWPR